MKTSILYSEIYKKYKREEAKKANLPSNVISLDDYRRNKTFVKPIEVNPLTTLKTNVQELGQNVNRLCLLLKELEELTRQP